MTSNAHALPAEKLQACYQTLRMHDRDRFITLLVLPEDWRQMLAVLLCLRLELARVRETVSEEMVGLIRLQWWRDTVEAIEANRQGTSHPVAEALEALWQSHPLPRHRIEAMIDAREEDLQAAPPATLEALEAYLRADLGGVYATLLEAYGAPTSVQQALMPLLQALGLAGMVRSTGYFLTHEKLWIPQNILTAAGVSVEELRQRPEAADWPVLWRPLLHAASAHRKVAERLLPEVPKPWRSLLDGLHLLAERYAAPLPSVTGLDQLAQLPPAMTLGGMLSLLYRRFR